MKTATLVDPELIGWSGDARLYKLDPPLANNEYVVVSAVVVPFDSGPETYIFASDDSGNVKDYLELDGSFKGGLDHAAALNGAGYEIS